MNGAVLLLSLLVVQSDAARADGQKVQDTETLIDLDVKNANVLDLLRLLAELGGLNLVADPDVECRFTLSLKAVTWLQVMELTLRSCRLGEEWMGENLVRVASMDRLTKEHQERRRYKEEKRLGGPLRTTYRPLSYARAREVAPLLQKLLSPRGEIAFDERTNTLIITDVAERD